MALLQDLQEMDEILLDQTHIWNHIFHFINSASLKCAVELGIPDIIHSHGRPITLQELADALHINKAKAHQLGRLMRVLTRSGFFLDAKITHGNGYALARPSFLLLKDHPFSLAPFVLGAVCTIFTGPWHGVSEWFRNDDPMPHVTAYGRTFWDLASQDPEINHYTNQAMAGDALLFMTLIRKYCRGVFEGLDSLVDVGGGTGMVAKAIADEFPNMKCTVLDLPHVVAGLEGTKNLAYVAGNMFQAIPPAQAVFLKRWLQRDARKLRQQCLLSTSAVACTAEDDRAETLRRQRSSKWCSPPLATSLGLNSNNTTMNPEASTLLLLRLSPSSHTRQAAVISLSTQQQATKGSDELRAVSNSSTADSAAAATWSTRKLSNGDT
nr:trans-resveratrol di-O-methyltransferase-like [Ipomoea batatas]